MARQACTGQMWLATKQSTPRLTMAADSRSCRFQLHSPSAARKYHMDLKRAGRYQPRAKFTTWLLKITRNLVFNELRRTKRRAQMPLQPEPGTEEIILPD